MDKVEQRSSEISEKFNIIGGLDNLWLLAMVRVIRAEAKAEAREKDLNEVSRDV